MPHQIICSSYYWLMGKYLDQEVIRRNYFYRTTVTNFVSEIL